MQGSLFVERLGWIEGAERLLWLSLQPDFERLEILAFLETFVM